MPHRIACPILLVVIAAAPGFAQAQSSDSRWRIGAAFGYGERSNPLVQSDDLPILIDLDVAWFGDQWFFDNGDAGFTFVDNDSVTVSAVGRINSDRVFFGRTETRFVILDAAGGPVAVPPGFKPPDRDYAVEIGIELLTDGQWGTLQVAGFHDVSDTHGGFELSADYSFSWRRRRWHIEPSIDLSYKSADLNNYYWGLTEAESGGFIPAYRAGSGVNWGARLTIGYQLNRKWTVSLVTDYERLNSEAIASPIVEERSVRGFFVGMARRF